VRNQGNQMALLRELLKLSESPTHSTTVKIEKGLSREEALKRAPWKKSYGDCRAFAYDPKTGTAVWT